MPVGEFTNCYAYACDCWDPPNGGNGGALPGAFAGAQVTAEQGETAETYANRLLLGIAKDVAANRLAYGSSLNVTASIDTGDGFLIAMLSNKVGFHFLRRGANGFWSWKDGHPEEPASTTQKVVGTNAGMAMPVSDMIFREMVGDSKGSYIPAWPNMTFRCYVRITGATGMKVDGKSS